MHENRETSPLTESSSSSRLEKGSDRTVQANGGEESDCVIVPEKLVNKAREKQAQAAEPAEGKGASRGEHATIPQAPGTERDRLVTGFAACA